MRINIDGIGMLKDTSIELNNLTVIAGENDSGKSTVGKVIYAIVKALRNYEERYKDFYIDRLESDYLQKISKIVRQDYNEEYYLLRKNIDPIFVARNIRFADGNVPDIQFAVNNYIDQITEITSKKDAQNTSMGSQSIKKRNTELNKLLILLKEEISENKLYPDNNKLFQAAIQQYLKFEFKKDINFKYCVDSGQIQVKEGKNIMLNLTISKNRVINSELVDKNIFSDATYIESPFVLNSTKYDKYSRNLDLINKLKLSDSNEDQMFFEELFDSDIDISNEIKQVIGGSLKYDRQERKFQFSKSNKYFDIVNIASGIKSLGIIKSLFDSNLMDLSQLLIIDEPEVHLHPEWQVKYGEILVKLASKGYNILIATHSENILQAIDYYSRKYGAKELISYYSSDKTELGQSKISDYTDKLNDIFEKLSYPFERLVWEVD